MKTKIIILSALFLVLPIATHAAPAVSGVSGSVNDGGSVIVNGAGFGIKATATPLIWDNFENCVDGTPLQSIEPSWVSQKTSGAICTNDAYAGSHAVKNTAYYDAVKNDGSTTINDFSTNSREFPPVNEVYYTYTFKSRLDSGDGYGVGKAGRIGSNSMPGISQYNGPGTSAICSNYNWFSQGTAVGVLSLDGTNNVMPYYSTILNGSTFPYYGGGSGVRCNSGNNYCQPVSDVWTRQEGYRRNSSPAGATNGQYVNTLDGIVAWNTGNNYITKPAGQTWDLNSVLLPLMFTNMHLGEQVTMVVDSVYADNTQARVELCDNNIWTVDTRKHCEIQVPSTWSDGSVSLTVNQGSFKSGDQAYIYIIDKDGNVNTNGYPVTIGGSVISPPPTPTTYNLSNFTQLTTDWLKTIFSPADVNKDGKVNSQDLGIMMSNWN